MEGVEYLMPVRGDVHNSRISMVDHLNVVGALLFPAYLNVVGALLLQSVYGIRYSNENIARQKRDEVGGLLPLKNL